MPGSNEEMQVYSPGCAACPHGAATATALLRAASAPASHSLLEVVAAVRPGAGSNACSVHQCGMRSRRTATADGGLGGGGGQGHACMDCGCQHRRVPPKRHACRVVQGSTDKAGQGRAEPPPPHSLSSA